MAMVLTIPKLQMSMTEGTLADWLVEDGTQVTEGEPLYILETDKASQDIESPATGRLVRRAQAGSVYPVGTEIGEIV